MSLSRARTVTIVVSLATFASNTLSSLLIQQLPDDPYHLATNFGWYLHLANLLNIFGLVGAMRQHFLSISVFSYYLLLDTLLCFIPRLLLLLTLLQPLSFDICSPPFSPSTSPLSTYSIYYLFSSQPSTITEYNSEFLPRNGRQEWSQAGCEQMLYLGGWTLAAGVVGAIILQFVGALTVREYARFLYVLEEQEFGDIVLDITHAEIGCAGYQDEKPVLGEDVMPPQYLEQFDTR